MPDQDPQHTLLDDLVAIRKSLDKISESKPNIPTLEEIVGHRTPTTVNPENPFLSSNSLSELIKIRNEAEANAAQELAELSPVKTVEEILLDEPEPPPVPDPDLIIEQMEQMFDSWIENSVSQYMELFEGELRNRLQQDFKGLVTQWYKEHELPLPESFEHRDQEQMQESEQQTGDEEDQELFE